MSLSLSPDAIVAPKEYCSIDLTKEKQNMFIYAIKNHYWYQMYIGKGRGWGHGHIIPAYGEGRGFQGCVSWPKEGVPGEGEGVYVCIKVRGGVAWSVYVCIKVR